MSSAIVTGATGITGSAIVHHLCKDPQYKKIYSLSRRNPGYANDKLREEMAKSLGGVSGEYVFFCAYLARDDPAELSRVNEAMLANFIKAQYGFHLGHCKQPLLEDDPLLLNNDQGSDGKGSDVLGYARGNFMNEATALGLYCSISKVLNAGSELPFPGCKANYFAFNTWTSANMHAKLCLWAATSTAAGVGNGIFNVTNGDTESFQNLWPRLSRRFGCRVTTGMFPYGGIPESQGFGEFESTTVRMGSAHPLAVHAVRIGVKVDDKGPPTLFLQIDPEKWAKRKDVNEAWVKLRDRYGLDQEAWEKATWDFLTFALGRDWSCVGSMSKARKLG
ncbi:hypothetical protein BJX99DRAFT_250890 [Aspergillus californicus]